MKIILPKLPYPHDALAPVISKETVDFHYDKHHRGYVDNLNKLIVGTRFADADSLEQIINASYELHSPATTNIFNNAAQIWNHTFYWNSMTPDADDNTIDVIDDELKDAIKDSFGSLAKFKKEFIEAGATQFGSGWVWLLKSSAKNSNKLSIDATHDAHTPLVRDAVIPLICCDVWEHGYYIDYRNDRKAYLKAFVDTLINWEFAYGNFNPTVDQ